MLVPTPTVTVLPEPPSTTVLSPSPSVTWELPVGPDRLWLRTARYGKRIRIDMPERTDEYLPLLLSGKRAAERAPVEERDVALRAARTGSCESVTALLRRVHGGWRVTALTATWLLFPSQAYVRDVVATRGGARTALYYLRRPVNYVRGRIARRLA